eukprot:m.164205 g.164205  ORF g.164205 m.164205 type:complete len:188 (+) comp18111_c0_seq58:1423-1986(+)
MPCRSYTRCLTVLCYVWYIDTATGYHIDRRDRPVAIRELYKLSGSPYLVNASCLELDEFADELLKIKASGSMGLLHKRKMVPHFASATLTCDFDRINYQQITQLESFKYTAPNVQLRFLADRLNVSLEEQPYRHTHQSTIPTGDSTPVRDLEVSESTYQKLYDAYDMDYAALGNRIVRGDAPPTSRG